jgi:Ca2+-binding EF-hand superfamily protein
LIGQNPTDEYIEDMIKQAPGSINFTMFLTLMGEKMSGTDPEPDILQAFEAFDEHGKGYINADDLREFMTTMGDRFTDEEVNNFFILYLYIFNSYHRLILCSKELP